MPILELKQKIEFNVDQMTIDRIEALAALDGLSLDAWLRRLVDDIAGLGTRQMKQDQVFFALRPAVIEIIKILALKISPLQTKAQKALERIKTIKLEIKSAPPEDLAKKKKRSIKFVRSETDLNDEVDEKE